MEKLLKGYQRFRKESWPERRAAFEALSDHGQHPQVLVIACVDSRVDPAVIFDTAPGQLLTIRNVANLVPPFAPDAAYHGTSAAVEFGIRVLNIPHLVVLGHGQCGGVRALLNGAPPDADDFISQWMSIAAPARRVALRCDTPDAQEQCCEQEVVKISLANLRSFPWLKEREDAGRLALHGAWFAIRTGVLSVLGGGWGVCGCGVRQGKQSFFEKKDQKTFAFPAARAPAPPPPDPFLQNRRAPGCRRRSKSLLLLFFRKEGLPSYS